MEKLLNQGNGILASSRKKWVIEPRKHIEEPQMYITRLKNPIRKGYKLWCSGKGKTVEIVRRPGVSGAIGEERSRGTA